MSIFDMNKLIQTVKQHDKKFTPEALSNVMTQKYLFRAIADNSQERDDKCANVEM